MPESFEALLLHPIEKLYLPRTVFLSMNMKTATTIIMKMIMIGTMPKTFVRPKSLKSGGSPAIHAVLWTAIGLGFGYAVERVLAQSHGHRYDARSFVR